MRRTLAQLINAAALTGAQTMPNCPDVAADEAGERFAEEQEEERRISRSE